MKPIMISSLVILMLAGCAGHSMNHSAVHEDHRRRHNNFVTQDENKKIVSDFFEQFSAGRIDEAFSMVSDDVRWWVPGDLPFSGTKSKSEYLEVVGAIQNGFPGGLELNATSMLAEGNKVAVEVASYGEHANGKTYKNQYHFLITIEESKIVDVKEYMDTLHLYQLIMP